MCVGFLRFLTSVEDVEDTGGTARWRAGVAEEVKLLLYSFEKFRISVSQVGYIAKNNGPAQGTRWTMWLQKLSVHKQYKESPISGISRVLHVLHIWFVWLKKTGTKNYSEVSLCWLSVQWQNKYTTGITVLGTFRGRTWDTFYIAGKPSWAANLMKCRNYPFMPKPEQLAIFMQSERRLSVRYHTAVSYYTVLQVFTIFSCKLSVEKWTHITFNAKKVTLWMWLWKCAAMLAFNCLKSMESCWLVICCPYLTYLFS